MCGKMPCWMSVVAVCATLLGGCAIYEAAQAPVTRDPARIAGQTRNYIDRRYGCPIASGEHGGEYWEELQFVDGMSRGAKVTLIVANSFLDVATALQWEWFGSGLLYLMYLKYDEHVGFVSYGGNGRAIRYVDVASPEGRDLYGQPWAVSKRERENRSRRVSAPRKTLVELEAFKPAP